MKLTAKEIRKVKFSVDYKGYSAKEVDEFLDQVIDDYKEIEKSFKEKSTIRISSKYDGELMPNTVKYEGTIAEWKAIENKGIFENVPCINCTDGQYIQKL